MSRSRENEPFVGRGKELAVLVSALDDASAGHGRIVTISGEPGIGKTRCAEELSTIAEGLDFRVAWGHALESMGAPAYWPWIEAIEEIIRDFDDDELSVAVGDGAGRIAGIVPGVSNRLGSREVSRSDEAEAARFKLFSALSHLLRGVAEPKGLVVILEDLNWADDETLNLLEFLASRIASMKVVVVGTYRDVELSRRHRLSATLGALVRSGVYERLALHRLTEEETDSYIRGTLRQSIDSQQAEEIRERAEGNPLFLRETVRQLNDSGDFSIAEGIREVIGRRLDRLSAGCNELLATAAVLGRGFSVEHLMLIDSEIDTAGVTEMIDEAIRAGLIESGVSKRGSFRFSHALIQQTLSDELSITRRVQLHARIAQAFTERYGDDAGHAANLLHHYSNAQLILGCEQTVRYSLIAGDRARESFAFDEAIRCYLVGLDCIGDEPMNDAKAALYVGLGRASSSAESGMRSYPEGFERLVEAFEYYVESGKTDLAVGIATIHTSSIGYWNAAMALRMYSNAIDLVEPNTESGVRVRCLFGRYLLETSYGSEVASGHLEKALDEARGLGRVDLELFVLSSWILGVGKNRDWETTARLISESERIEGREHYVDWQQICECIGFYYVASGVAPARSLEYHLEAHRLSKINHFRVESTANNLVMAYRMRGQYDAALKVVEATPEVSGHPLISAQIALIELASGDTEAGMIRIRSLIESSESMAGRPGYESVALFWLLFDCVILGLIDESYLDVAARAAERVRHVRPSPAESERGTLFPTGHLAAIYALQGRCEAAMKMFETIDNGVESRTFFPEMAALVHASDGRRDEARELLSEVRDLLESHNVRGRLPILYFTFLRLLTENGDPSDAAEAKRYVMRLRELAEESGFTALSESIDRYSDRIDEMAARNAKRGQRPVRPAGLTPREIDVLTQLASGKSNHEIGEALFISEKTVHTHVYNVFQKLDVGNRTEAAAKAMKLGIEPAPAE